MKKIGTFQGVDVFSDESVKEGTLLITDESKLLNEVSGIISTDDIAKDILAVLRDISLSEEEVMAQIMVLISKRDDKLTNYAYKMGRSSV